MMSGARIICLAYLILTLLAAGHDAASARKPVNFCLGCHGARPVTFHRQSGETRVIAIDMERLRQSEHGEVDCQQCHVRGFAFFPHPMEITETRTCLECHPREGDAAEFDRAYHFDAIGAEFRDTAHHASHPEAFRCESCHNPHAVKPPDGSMPIATLVETQNAICRECHVESAAEGPLAAPAEGGLPAVHAGLPHAALHLDGVRCVDCHAPADAAVSHRLGGRNGRPARCGDCHARETILNTKLLRHHPKDSSGGFAGFTNAGLLRHAYVFGATRSVVIDWLGYLAVGAVALGLAAHGGLSLYFRQRPRRRHNVG